MVTHNYITSPTYGISEERNMSNHNNLNWTDFLLCIGMELAFTKNGENPINEQMIAEKIIELGGKI